MSHNLDLVYGAVMGGCIAAIVAALAPLDAISNDLVSYNLHIGPSELGVLITLLGFFGGGIAEQAALARARV
jgi:hypothetical protein